MSDLALVVMAAGLGSRYGGLKQIDPVGPNDEAVISYSVYDAIRAGFERIVFVIREEMEFEFKEHVGKPIEERADTTYVFQKLSRLPHGCEVPPGREKPWGTGHALLCCKDVVSTPFAVITADDLYGPSSYRVLCDYLKEPHGGAGGPDYCMVGFLLKNTLSPHGHVARAVCTVTPDGYLTNIIERTRIRALDGRVKYAEDDGRWVEVAPDTVISMNMWGFTPSLFDELERGLIAFLRKSGRKPNAEYYIPSAVEEMIRDETARVRVLPTDEAWFGVTYREDLSPVQEAVRDMIRRGVYPKKLWS